jgi:putative FmdB family regulatory protein
MPLYEYQCDACDHRFEVIKKYSDPPLKVCPKCGGAVHKLQSAPAFQFKGTGWYVTDYPKKDQAETTREDSGSKDASETKDAPAKIEQGGKSEKSDKSDKNDKSEKSQKGEKTEKSEKREKREKREKDSSGKPSSKTSTPTSSSKDN